jgi:hypothetical protein
MITDTLSMEGGMRGFALVIVYSLFLDCAADSIRVTNAEISSESTPAPMLYPFFFEHLRIPATEHLRIPANKCRYTGKDGRRACSSSSDFRKERHKPEKVRR